MSDDNEAELNEPELNEIAAAAHEAKRARAAADASVEQRKSTGNWPIGPISIGIGSTALVAALMYANRSRKKR